jgi:signal-transduction protein with cAMP-binding, CBS, and nucleotidyltransferase domain/PAS domain-containing protein
MNEADPQKKRKVFLLKVDLPALLAIILFAGMIFLYLIPTFENVMMDRKRNLIHEMTASVYSLLDYYHGQELAGTLERQAAQEEARKAINTIRYGQDLKDYFWITDLVPVMITHPYRPDLNGHDLTNFHDSKGKAIFVDFVKAVADGGESYVEYMWQWNDDSTRIVPKLSYVRLFEPWGWVVGTGIYVEDVRTEIRRMEIRALAISGIFGLLIISLLFAISRQSHKIEQKRSSAERELHKSRELYRTLAEAASEGVIIWSDPGLQANKTLLSWIEYREEEILKRPLSDVLNSQGAFDTDNPGKLYEELTARQYVECLLTTKAGRVLSCHADLSRITIGDQNAVLIVIRPAGNLSPTSGINLPSALLDNAGTGFFRTTYGRKPKFINATAPFLEYLGYSDLQELHQQYIETLFADPRQYELVRKKLESRKGLFNEEMVLKRKDGNELLALVTMIVVDTGADEIWCDGSVEILAASASSSVMLPAGYEAFGASYITELPVSSVMGLPVTCPENTPYTRALSLMKENNTGVIVVLSNSGEPMGVASSWSIGFGMSETDQSGTSIFRFMQAPPSFIDIHSRIASAVDRIKTSKAGCLLVMTADNKLAGTITNDDLVRAFSMTPALILNEIAGAGYVNSLKNIWHNNRKIALSMLLGHADPYSLSLHISCVADAICRRVIDLCIEKAGKPPCRFSFIQTGSAGRKEQSFLTDQDNAIIFENLEGARLREAEEYFLDLGRKTNEMLDSIGFRLCKGNNMAGNPKWCQPLDRWKSYFSDWIKTPGPSEILDVSIFFDFRHCYGDLTLCEGLRDYVKTSLQTSDIFFYHMSLVLKQFNPSRTVLAEDETDIKRVLMALTGVIRLYALKHGLDGLSTVERITELHAGKHIGHEILRGALHAWKDLTYIRLSHQASCITSGKEPDNRVDFKVRYADMQLPAARAIEEINNLMLKAGNDFHSVTI